MSKLQPQLRMPANGRMPRPASPPSRGPVSVADLIAWSDAVAWDSVMTPAAKALANLVRSRVDRKTGYAFFSDQFASLHTGYNRRTLTRAREQLGDTLYLVTWRPSRTLATEYYPQIVTARDFLAELKEDRKALRGRPAIQSSREAGSDDDIPF